MFDKKIHLSALTKIFAKNSKSSLLSISIAESFTRLSEIMLRENEKYNLTSVTEPDKIALNHYLDCAMLQDFIPHGARVCDVGCGAGFPTLPLAILRPDLTIWAVDSTAKRVSYVIEAAKELELTNVIGITGRAEELSAIGGEYRESFDIVTARAVAALPVLCELCLPLTKLGGKFLAMKGKNAEYELRDSKRAISILGGKLEEVHDITLVGNDESITHPIILIKKQSRTPATYPRQYSRISKKPL